MQLKYVEMQGFKSFPDKTVINFSSGITAIVGPNGSGKSNIGDAFRWVMGETSSKSLRGSKMEDVIFDGTSERKPMGFAEVTMVFDNSDRTLNIEFDEVSIGRRCYRSGESEYFINRNNVRMRDIHDLLFDTGLGRQGYSIIGQGAITSIIEAKSTERRFLFEEAAGISKFRSKKEEALRRLERTQDNILRVGDIINELKERIGPLEQQAAKARKYIALRDERKTLEVSLWVMRLQTLRDELERARESARIYSEDLEKISRDLAGQELKIAESVARSEKATARIEQLRAQIKEFDESSQSKQTLIVVANNDIEHMRADIARIEASTAAAAEEVSASLGELETRRAEERAFRAEAEEIRARIDGFSEQMRGEEELKLGAEEKIRGIERRAEEEEQKLTVLRVQLGAAEQSLESGDKFLEERRRDIEDAKERLRVLSASREQAAQTAAQTERRIEECRNVQSGYLVKIQNRKAKLEALEKRLSDARLQLSDKQSRLNVLIGMEKHYEGFQNSVKTVMDAASNGTLTGVEGTVAELIKVADQYTVAVETALGGALQNVVTLDERSAKNAIYFLKNRNAGRATFLPITNIKASGLRSQESIRSEDGFVGFASELVDCEEKYREIVDFLLCRTVVAEDMESASAIGRRNRYSFRVVTLDGQVVNVGGSLTGGSAAKNFGILSRRGQIDSLSEECGRLRSDTDRLSSEYKSGKEDLDSMSAFADAADAELRTLNEKLIKEKGELERCDGYLDNMRRQESLLSEELEKISRNRSADEQRRALLEDKIKEAEAGIASRADELSAAKDELEKHIGLRDVYLQKSHESEMLLLEKNKNAENAAVFISQIEQRILAQRQDSEKLASEIEEIERRISDKKDGINILESDKAELERESVKAAEEVRVLVGERAEAERTAQKLRDEERDMFSLREKLARDIDKHNSMIDGFSTERDTIITKLWDEYELTLSEAGEQCVQIEDMDEAARRASAIRASMKALGDVNLASVDEYVAVKERYEGLTAQVDDLNRSREELEKLISDLTGRMESLFSEKFETINAEFKKVFRELFGGGSAELKLEQPGAVLESGIEIFAAPPGKVIKNLMLLSGGERALTAIALYFAVLKIKPAPFCLLDEIEAALDEVNVARYAEYLHRRDKTQFIAITHRRGTMEAADSIYGVTMREKGVSRILSVDIKDISHKYN